MAAQPFVTVGRIAKTHGLKGEVSVRSYAGTSLDFLVGADVWFVPPPRALRSAPVISTRQGPKGVLLTLGGVTSIDAAAELVGREILVSPDVLPTGWGEEQVAEYDGFAVHDDAHGSLGTVAETIVTGANDVLVVDGPFGEILVPVISDVVLQVDTDQRTIHVKLLPGLLEEDGAS